MTEDDEADNTIMNQIGSMLNCQPASAIEVNEVEVEVENDSEEALTLVSSTKSSCTREEKVDSLPEISNKKLQRKTSVIKSGGQSCYIHGYKSPMFASTDDIEQGLLFNPAEDLLDYRQFAEAISISVHSSDYCAVVGIFGERGGGRSAFLELLWQALQRRQAEAHAREISNYIRRSCCAGWAEWLGFVRWRRCAPCLVDNGGSGTLHGYYILCKIECTDLLSSDRVWGTVLDALTSAIAREYGAWALPYLARVGASNFPRSGPVFLKLVLCTILKLALFVFIVFLLVMLILRQKKSRLGSRIMSAFSTILVFYVSSVAFLTASVALGYLSYICKSKARQSRAESRAEEEDRWRAERSGFHGKVFSDLSVIGSMLEVHVRHRRKWPLCLRMCIPDIIDGLLCDLFFTCYAWPEVIVLVDDLDKVPSPIAVRLLEALTALANFEAPKRRANPFKIIFGADSTVVDIGLSQYFAGASSAYSSSTLVSDGLHHSTVSTGARRASGELVAEGERFLRSFITMPFELPSNSSADKKSALASRLLSQLGVRAIGDDDEADTRGCCCPCLSSGPHTVSKIGLYVPDDVEEGTVLSAELTGGVVIMAPTPQNAIPGQSVVQIPIPRHLSSSSKKLATSARRAAGRSAREAQRLSLPKNRDPQYIPHKEWRKAAAARTSFGGELLPSDLSVFEQLASFVPGNPRRMWRVVTTFHVAQRVARHFEAHSASKACPSPDLRHSVAASPAWRARLLRFVLAGERWPARTAWLRHVTDRLVYHDDSWADSISGPLPKSTPLIHLHDSVVLPLLDILCGHDDASTALLALDDGSVQEFRKLIIGDSLTVADFCSFELICRNNSNALLRHVALCSHRVWPSSVLLASGSPSHCLSPPSSWQQQQQQSGAAVHRSTSCPTSPILAPPSPQEHHHFTPHHVVDNEEQKEDPVSLEEDGFSGAYIC